MMVLLRMLFGIALSVTFVAASDSCTGRCWQSADMNYDCQCNSVCMDYGDCCTDFSICDSAMTCIGRDCFTYDSSQKCQCNDLCANYGNCCPDRNEVCTGTGSSSSCSGRCGQAPDTSYTCQCNTVCSNYGDCCADYSSQCDSGSTGGGGSTGGCSKLSVTNTELRNTSFVLWGLDTNSFPEGAVQYNIQGSTTTSSTNDVAPDPFFIYVDESLFQGTTYQKLMALQDNYFRTQGETEIVTEEELNENNEFLDVFLATPVGIELFNFLNSKNLAGCNGIEGFKTILNDIWFGMYNRQAPDDTSGFEHSFVGEIKGSSVSGFHNWVYFYYQELYGNFNYQGYVSNLEPRMVGMRHTWYGAPKKMNGFTIGTSPEIEFALYTLCHLARPGSVCPVDLADSAGNRLERSIQTYTWSGESAPNGQSYIASAYFIS